jgi:hypothetical protein
VINLQAHHRSGQFERYRESDSFVTDQCHKFAFANNQDFLVRRAGAPAMFS